MPLGEGGMKMNKDRRNWAVMIILFILLVSIFFVFGPTYYESLDIVGKRIFMLPVQIVIAAIGYYIGRWFLDRRNAKSERDENNKYW